MCISLMNFHFIVTFLLPVRNFAGEEMIDNQLNALINCTETYVKSTSSNNQSKTSISPDQFYKLFFKGRFHPAKLARKGVVQYKLCSPLEARFLKSEKSCYDVFKVLITEYNTIFYVPYSDIERCKKALYKILRAGANQSYVLPELGPEFGFSNRSFETLVKPDLKQEPRRMLDESSKKKQKVQNTAPNVNDTTKKRSKRAINQDGVSSDLVSKKGNSSGSAVTTKMKPVAVTTTVAVSLASSTDVIKSSKPTKTTAGAPVKTSKAKMKSHKNEVIDSQKHKLTKNNNIVLITDIISGSNVNETLVEKLFNENRSDVHDLYAFLLVIKDPGEKARYVKELMNFARTVNQKCTNFVCKVNGLMEKPAQPDVTESPKSKTNDQSRSKVSLDHTRKA